MRFIAIILLCLLCAFGLQATEAPITYPFQKPTWIAFVGDSIAAGYPHTVRSTYSAFLTNQWWTSANTMFATNAAVSGSRMRVEIPAQYTNGIQGRFIINAETNGILFVEGGVNDFSNTEEPSANVYASTSNLCYSAALDGWKIVIVGVTSKTNNWSLASATNATNYNLAVAASVNLRRVFVDAKGLLPDSTNPEWFEDGTHWTTNAHRLVATNIAGLLARPFLSTETRLALTNSSLWRGYIGNAPASNSVQTLNPPLFRWTYLENPADSYSEVLRTFRFLVGFTNDFAAPVVDVICSNNFYNFLAPFTNGDGSAYTSPVYWRVIYMNSNATVNVSTSEVRSFTLSATATNWDRSALASFAAITNRTSQHPHVFFKENERTNALNFLLTNVQALYMWNGNAGSISNSAFNVITNEWWTNAAVAVPYAGAEDVAKVAFVYQMLTNHESKAILSNANPWFAANRLADDWVAQGFDNTLDVRQAWPKQMVMAYDWLYPGFTELQRSNILWSFESTTRRMLYRDWWFNASTAASNTYPNWSGPYKMDYVAASRLGDSHGTRGIDIFSAYFAVVGDSPVLWEYWQYGMNYLLGQSMPYMGDSGTINVGRIYSEAVYQHNRTFGSWAFLGMVFPELELNKLPRFTGSLDWWMHMQPTRFSEVLEPWGDNGTYVQNPWMNAQYRDLVLTTRRGDLWQMYHNAYRTKGYIVQNATGNAANYETLLSEYCYPTNAFANAATSFVAPDEGWAISSSVPPNDLNAFSNGVAFVFQARPRGGDMNHSSYTDGHVQMWAYGAMLTENGPGNYRKVPWYYNVTLVDGIGTCLPQRPFTDYFSMLTAWTNNSDFTYAAGDLTRAYNRSNFSIGNFSGNPDFAIFYATNRIPQTEKVERHVLFPHKKYLVIYDSMQSTQDSRFTWVWHIMEPTATVDTNNCAFTYTATNWFNGSNVTVHVRHIVNPALMTLTNLAGTNLARANPITGEDYGATDDADNASPYPRQNSTEWVSNQTKTTNWHFLTVVYPQHWTNETAPTITRLDDYTVAVTNAPDGVADIISFDTNSAVATLIVDAGATNAPPPEQTATPTFSPAGPTVDVLPTNVTVSVESGAFLFWRTNASWWGTSAASVAVEVNYGTTLYAYATNVGKLDSYTNSVTYATNAPAPPPASTNRAPVMIIQGNVRWW